jgi:hypothetical protein
MSADMPVTEETIERVRQQAASVYSECALNYISAAILTATLDAAVIRLHAGQRENLEPRLLVGDPGVREAIEFGHQKIGEAIRAHIETMIAASAKN